MEIELGSIRERIIMRRTNPGPQWKKPGAGRCTPDEQRSTTLLQRFAMFSKPPACRKRSGPGASIARRTPTSWSADL